MENESSTEIYSSTVGETGNFTGSDSSGFEFSSLSFTNFILFIVCGILIIQLIFRRA